MKKNTTADRNALAKVFRENRGLLKSVALAVGLRANSVSMWLNGHSPSQRLDREVPGIVARLLRERAKNAA